jgi:hypothetical protein
VRFLIGFLFLLSVFSSFASCFFSSFHFLDPIEETNLPDIFHQFLDAFSTLLPCCALDSTFISFITCFTALYVGFLNYVSVGGTGIPRPEAGYDYLSLPTQFDHVVLPTY